MDRNKKGMKKRLAMILTLALSLALLLSGCAPKASEAEATTAAGKSVSGEVLNIGILPAESAIPIILALEKGFFEETGLQVAIKAFSSPNDRNVAVQAKELDGVIGDVMTGAAFVDKGIPMKITSDISVDF